jgi:hypothetical protein
LHSHSFLITVCGLLEEKRERERERERDQSERVVAMYCFS